MNTSSSTRAWIFINGTLTHPEVLASRLKPDDFLIAADGGARHLLRLGKVPHVLIGDLDSLTLPEVENLEAKGCKVWRFPAYKDWTDLELAIDYALDRDFKSIRLTAAGGGRVDQQLGNLFLLTRSDLLDCDIAIDDGTEEIFLIQNQREIHGQMGDRISLIPLDEQVEGVSSQGLEWPLEDEVLYRSATRGISNIMVNDTAIISARSGNLLCIHTRKEFLENEETH